MLEGPCADSEDKHEPASDADAAVVDSLKALDLNRPIRKADIARRHKPNRPHSRLPRRCRTHDADHEEFGDGGARPLLTFARRRSSACLLSAGLHGLTQRRKNTVLQFIPVKIDTL